MDDPKWKRILENAQKSVMVPPEKWEVKPNILCDSSTPFVAELESCYFLDKYTLQYARDTIDSCWEVVAPHRFTIFCSHQQRGSISRVAKAGLLLLEFIDRASRVKLAYRPSIVLILLDLPKTANGSQLATYQNVNSGVCFGSHLIMIWREEEVFKVLVHELLHAYKWDRCIDEVFLGKLHRDIFPLSSTLSARAPRESVTETCTVLLTSILEGLMTGKNPREVFKKQLYWSTLQMVKVWNRISRDPQGCFEQETDVLSYYVLKTFFLWAIALNRNLEGVFLGFDDQIATPHLLRSRTLYDSMERHMGKVLHTKYAQGVLRSSTLRMSPPFLFHGI